MSERVAESQRWALGLCAEQFVYCLDRFVKLNEITVRVGNAFNQSADGIEG